ncbi:MAG: glutathione peroxidase [Bernardetiaceae bacterium]|nr:glutathione peroxidase [Bernardetiaceae bacterium]
MCKNWIFAVLLLPLLLACQTQAGEQNNESNNQISTQNKNLSTMTDTKTIYDFTLTDIDGNEKSLADFKGKKLMIVNVASRCGYTKQYADLQEVHEKYGDKIAILGFPANNFGGQEPGTDSEIKEFCSTKFNVSFPMFSKISVVGNDQHELYQWLKAKTDGQEPSWNFCKYMVSEDGETVTFHNSGTNPGELVM